MVVGEGVVEDDDDDDPESPHAATRPPPTRATPDAAKLLPRNDRRDSPF